MRYVMSVIGAFALCFAWALTPDEVMAFPFTGVADMARMNSLARAEPPTRFVLEVEAFTRQPASGERVRIVSFSTSNDKAIRRLRDQVKIKPPPGGAVLRVYPSQRAMPKPIRDLFTPSIAGLNTMGRFCAVDADNRGKEELADTISHELTHAYIMCTLGPDADLLPRWFHEGVALWLSDAKDIYITDAGFNGPRASWSPQDYSDYRSIFLYLEYTLGTKGVETFIRESVIGKSVSEPLFQATGCNTYDQLLARVQKWQAHKQAIWYITPIALALIILAGYGATWHRRQSIFRRLTRLQQDTSLRLERLTRDPTIAETQPHEPISVARMLVSQAKLLNLLGQNAEAEEALQEALNLAAWSGEVQDAVQQASNEAKGYRV